MTQGIPVKIQTSTHSSVYRSALGCSIGHGLHKFFFFITDKPFFLNIVYTHHIFFCVSMLVVAVVLSKFKPSTPTSWGPSYLTFINFKIFQKKKKISRFFHFFDVPFFRADIKSLWIIYPRRGVLSSLTEMLYRNICVPLKE